jgi:hypothetical protein
MRIALLVGLLACSKTSNDAPKAAEPPVVKAAAERWAGSFLVVAKIVDFVVVFDSGGAKLEGLSKEPVPLADVVFTPDRIAFTIKKPNGDERSELVRTGDAAVGTDTFGAQTFPVKMMKLAEGEAPHSAYLRPQTPKPPWPYDTRDVTVDAPDGGKLAGTLTLPKATGPAPAILLWSGSGQQDRDETIFNHKPFLIIADKLTRAGFVVLRLDDRLTGKTVGAIGTLDTEIADAGAAIDFLKTQKEVDPKRVGMLGHSTGGMVVPNVALAHPLAFAVSIAGVAIPGRDLVPLQLQAAAKASGTTVPPETIAMQNKISDAAIAGADAVKKVLVEVIGEAFEKQAGRKPTQAELDQAMKKPLADATDPWAVSFFRIDPREAWKKLKMPVLLVVGDKDTQVPADVTIAALTGAHGNPAVVETHKLPGLNHMFQHATTGMVSEYADITESFDPATLDIIATWLAKQ